MKAITRIIIWSIVAVILSGVLIFGLIFGKTFFGSAINYSNAENYTKGGFSIDSGKIDSVEINWLGGKINISVNNKSTIDAKEDYSGNDDSSMFWMVESGKLTIQPCKSGFFEWHKTEKKTLDMTVPKSLADKIKNFGIDSVSAKIDIDSIKSDKLKIETVSGDLTAENVTANKLDLNTISGDLDITGSITDKVSVETVSGDLNLINSTDPTDIDCDSVSGNATLTIPGKKGFTLEKSSVSGDVTISDFATTVKNGKYIYLNGENKIDIESVSGDITIRKNA